jgi:plastocyanin
MITVTLGRLERIACDWLSALVILGLLTAGCGSGSGSGARPTTPTGSSAAHVGGTVQIVMKSLDFSPTAVRAKIGQRVTWTNEDTSPHNVTYVSGPRFRSSRPSIRPGQSFSLTLTEPGLVHYYCSIHPWMTARVAVSR